MCYDPHEIEEKFKSFGGDMVKINKWIHDMERQDDLYRTATHKLQNTAQDLDLRIRSKRYKIAETLAAFELKKSDDAKSIDDLGERYQSMHDLLSKVIPMAQETISMAKTREEAQDKEHGINNESLYFPFELETARELRSDLIKSINEQEAKRVKAEEEEKEAKRVKVEEGQQ